MLYTKFMHDTVHLHKSRIYKDINVLLLLLPVIAFFFIIFAYYFVSSAKMAIKQNGEKILGGNVTLDNSDRK